MQPPTPSLRSASGAGLALLVSLLLPAATAWAAAPTAVDDLLRVGPRERAGTGFQVVVDVLANDHDTDGDPLAIATFSPPRRTTGGRPLGSLHRLDDDTLVYLVPTATASGEIESVFFTYRLVGSNKTARVDIVPADDPGEPPLTVDARDDTASTAPGEPVVVAVLANDVGADHVRSVGAPQNGSAVVTADGASIVYSPAAGFAAGTDSFTYTAGSSLDPAAADTALVTVTVGPDEPPRPGPLAVVLRDTFSGMTFDEPLRGRFAELPGSIDWRAPSTLVHRGGAITTAADAGERMHARLAFDPVATHAASDYEIEAEVRPVNANWVAVTFSHGAGRLFADPPEVDLWLLLRPSGEWVLHSRGVQPLLRGTPGGGGVDSTPPFEFFADGTNHLRLRVEDSCPAASPLAGQTCLSAWINGTKVVDRRAYLDTSGGGPSTSPTTTITDAGFYVNRGAEGGGPGDARVDDFTVRAGELVEPHVDVLHAGAALHSGATLTAGPVVVGASDDLALTLRNTGDATLVLSGVVPPASGSGWTLVGSLPGSLAVGASAPVTLRLQSATAGSKTAELRFDTNDSSQPRFVVGLHGEVTAAADPPVARDDHFVTPMNQAFDVIFSTLLANDSGADIELSGPLTDPLHGSFGGFGPDGIVYIPPTDFVGGDRFTYSISNSGGSDSASVFITVDGPPTAAFAVTCAGLTCDFDAAASSDVEDGSPTSFSWSFGDGASGAGELVSHTYAASGTYSVTLTVADSLGQSGETIQTVVLDLPPVAAFTSACELATCSLDASGASDDNGIVAYQWSFGDGGAASGPPASHRTVTHAYGASGDYTVTLTVVDGAGQSAQAVDQVSIDLPPTAAFTWSCDSLTCSFDGGGSSDDFGVETWSWDFGDGSPATVGERVEHAFREEGAYQVRLIVFDARQQSDERVEEITVHDEELFLLLLVFDEE